MNRQLNKCWRLLLKTPFALCVPRQKCTPLWSVISSNLPPLFRTNGCTSRTHRAEYYTVEPFTLSRNTLHVYYGHINTSQPIASPGDSTPRARHTHHTRQALTRLAPHTRVAAVILTHEFPISLFSRHIASRRYLVAAP